VFSQDSLIGVGSGFSGERYRDERYGESWQSWWSGNQTRTWRWPQVEAQSLGLSLALRLSRIRGVSDDTKVSGRNDKTRECQPQILVETHYDYPDTHRDSGNGSAGKTSMR